jgi:hypothetical protein
MMVALRNEVIAPRMGAPGPRLRLVTAERPLPRVRPEALPDDFDYRDTGCSLSPSCLRCPLVRCKYDEPGGAYRHALDARDREIALLRTKHRAPINALASTYGVSRRTIFRILREHRRIAAAAQTTEAQRHRGSVGIGGAQHAAPDVCATVAAPVAATRRYARARRRPAPAKIIATPIAASAAYGNAS